MIRNNDFRPELRGDMVFLSDQAIDVLIKAGLKHDVINTARYGWLLRDCDTQEMQAIIADTLFDIACKQRDTRLLDD